MKEKILLFSEEEIARCEAKSEAWLLDFSIGNSSPVSIICPGGAYRFVSHGNEGEPFANYLNQRGHSAFVLNYRVAENARYPAPMEDLARAIEYIKANAERYGIDSSKISIWGSSAAGHLCSYFAADYKKFEKDVSLRPFASVLIYPVVNLNTETHYETEKNLLGEDSTEQQRIACSADEIATADYPPCFLFHCEDDGAVPVSNSLRLHKKLDTLGVKNELRIYPQGGHSCSTAEGTSAQGWIKHAVDFIESL